MRGVVPLLVLRAASPASGGCTIVSDTCYDDHAHMLPRENDVSPLTREYCAQVCTDEGFAVAGVEYGSQCFCGHKLDPNPKLSTGCTMPCSGDAKQMCGGSWAINVLEFYCGGDPEPKPTPLPAGPPAPPAPPAPPVSVIVDLSAARQPFAHYWKRSFGSGHGALTLRADWQAHLKQAVADLGLEGVRHHGLLDDDMAVVQPGGEFDFTRVEKSWDYQRSLGVTPLVELSFMPAVLAGCSWTAPNPAPGDPKVVNPGHSGCHTGMQYRHIDQHPQDWEDWYRLVKALAARAVAKYGVAEVRKWRFEVWNEMWGMDFPGSYMKLYNASAAAVKAVDSALRVGGPATMQLQHTTDFIKQCNDIGAPFDFVSTHMYPTDPQCKGKWNADCLPDAVKQAQVGVAKAGVPLLLTEYNAGCCEGHDWGYDNPGAAAFIFRTVPQLEGVVDVLSWWTFTDIFEEGTAVAKHSEYMNVYGLMTVSGVPKPGWRAFQLLHQLAGTQRVNVTVSDSSVSAFATVDAQGGSLHVFLGVWVQTNQPNELARTVTVSVGGGAEPTSATEYRIDDTHANGIAAWKEMGSPGTPTQAQVAAFVNASEVRPAAVAVSGGEVTVELPQNSAVVLAFS